MSRIRNPAENIRAAAIFVRVGETGSFASAAQSLGMSASGVSKAISRLEARLGVRLFSRTTRSLSLTEEGALFFEACRELISRFEKAEDDLSRLKKEPFGRIRVQLPRGFGRRVIIPALEAFLEANKDVIIDVVLDSRLIDLAEERLDIALRFGKPPATRYIGRLLCKTNYVLCAAPKFISRYGQPKDVQDLQSYRCLSYVRPETGRLRDWSIGRSSEAPFSPKATLAVDDIYAITEAAVAGLGIAYLPDYIAAAHLKSKQLQLVLAPMLCEGPSLYMFYRQRSLPPRTRVFVDFIQKLVTREPDWYRVTRDIARATR